VEVVQLLLAASATALATGLGAVPVFLLGSRAAALQPALLGTAIGVMGVASIVGLLLPALDEGSATGVAVGLATGVAFLLLARRYLSSERRTSPRLRSAGVRTVALVFLVLFVHSLPEGFAIGSAYASETSGLALFVIVAIAIHNIPEGTSVAIPMQAAGYSRGRQFWAAVATSIPQPAGALIAYVLVEQVQSLLAASFAFAAGAMLALVAFELVPLAFRARTWRSALAGTLAGGVSILALSAALGV
jgi:ZIP family zinc transporter